MFNQSFYIGPYLKLFVSIDDVFVKNIRLNLDKYFTVIYNSGYCWLIPSIDILQRETNVNFDDVYEFSLYGIDIEGERKRFISFTNDLIKDISVPFQFNWGAIKL